MQAKLLVKTTLMSVEIKNQFSDILIVVKMAQLFDFLSKVFLIAIFPRLRKQTKAIKIIPQTHNHSSEQCGVQLG